MFDVPVMHEFVRAEIRAVHPKGNARIIKSVLMGRRWVRLVDAFEFVRTCAM